jgi:sodium/proline symporter
MTPTWHYFFSSMIYLIIILSIGTWSRKKNKNFDPHLGGRSMNFWTTALSAHASDMSAWLFLSLPMLVWQKGAEPIWIALGLWIGMGLNWLIIAKRLRDKTAKANCFTLPAWLHRAYGDDKGVLRVLCACISTLFLLHYLAAGLIAMGLLMEQLFGLQYSLSILVAVVVITAYTMKGGFNAVAWVDLFQAIFLLLAITIVPLIGWKSTEGLASIQSAATAKSIPLWPWNMPSNEKKQAIVTAIGWGLGYFGMPHILSKFMGIRSSNELKKSMVVGLIWQASALLASIAVGLVGLGMVGLDLNNPEMLFVNMVEILFHPLAAGFIFCAIMAANLSTMDSQLLVTASVIVEDVIGPTVKLPKMYHVVAFRLATLSLAVVAWAIASTRNSTVQEAVFYSWSGLGAAYGPIILGSLYLRQAHWQSACLSLIGSCTCVVNWAYLEPSFNQIIHSQLTWPPLLPGFFIGGLILLSSEAAFILKKSFIKDD